MRLRYIIPTTFITFFFISGMASATAQVVPLLNLTGVAKPSAPPARLLFDETEITKNLWFDSVRKADFQTMLSLLTKTPPVSVDALSTDKKTALWIAVDEETITKKTINGVRIDDALYGFLLCYGAQRDLRSMYKGGPDQTPIERAIDKKNYAYIFFQRKTPKDIQDFMTGKITTLLEEGVISPRDAVAMRIEIEYNCIVQTLQKANPDQAGEPCSICISTPRKDMDDKVVTICEHTFCRNDILEWWKIQHEEHRRKLATGAYDRGIEKQLYTCPNCSKMEPQPKAYTPPRE